MQAQLSTSHEYLNSFHYRTNYAQSSPQVSLQRKSRSNDIGQEHAACLIPFVHPSSSQHNPAHYLITSTMKLRDQKDFNSSMHHVVV